MGAPRPNAGRVGLLAGFAIAAAAALPSEVFGQGIDPLADIPFRRAQIDANAGDVKLVGDLDLDGTADVVLGGQPAEGLNWYQYPSWRQTRIATPSVEFTTDGALGDVDGDGDLDIIVPDGSTGTNLLWFENPRLSRAGNPGNPFAASRWTRRTIGAIGSWCKDVELADFDQDGRLDVAARRSDQLMVFFQIAPDTWSVRNLAVQELGTEGMASGDIDRDGDVDLVVRGAWLDNPGGPAARTPSRWREHAIDPSGSVSPTFKAVVVDLDGDGSIDVLFSSSEATADVTWHEAQGAQPAGVWTRHVIAAAVERAHTLQVADMDRDGDLDVVVGQMHTAAELALKIYRNLGGARSWLAQTVDHGSGVHNGVVADLGADGDFDIVGCNWTGNPPLHVWENLTPQPALLLSACPLVGGRDNLIRVTNATPGSVVAVFYSVRGLSLPYHLPLCDTTLSLVHPAVLAWPTAPQNGVVDIPVWLPRRLRGITVWLQAIAVGRNSRPVVCRVR